MNTNWPVKKLGEVCEVVAGGTPSTAVSDYWGGNILWLTPKDLGANDNTEIFDTERKITEAGLKNSSAKLLPVGAVILSTRAPIGHLAIAGKPMATNQGCKSFVCGKNIDNKFLYWILKHNVETLQSLGSGATFTEISKRIVENFEIPVPPIEEQKRIVKKLEKILAKIEEAKKLQKETQQELELLTQSVLHQAFQGELAK